MVLQRQKEEKMNSSAHHFENDKKSASIFRTQEVDISKIESDY